jgi:predicted dithiol-disulfide oxidoreductase (DUF899 family)
MASNHRIVPHAEWIEERKKLLAKEKEFNRLRDQLSAQRRELPWERVEKQYTFEGPTAKKLFRNCSTARASWSFIISCSILNGTPDARIARSGPTISIASRST